MDHDFSKATKGGEEVTARNLRTLKLWEISPVIWGMNSATTTTGTKQKEQKPWDVFPEDGQYCVYKVDEEGDPTGDSLGCHPTEAEAQTQIAALHASVDEEDDKQMTEEDNPEIVPDGEGPFLCECIECGHEMETTEHCQDVECPECGGQMRRAGRPGAGKSLDIIIQESLETLKPLMQARKEAMNGVTLALTIHQLNEWLIENQAGVVFDSDGNLVKLWKFEDWNIASDADSELLEAVMMKLQPKAGRVLAQRNAEKLVTALSTIIAILEDAGIDVPGFEKLPQAKPPEDDDAPDKQVAIETSDVKQAGPDGDPPTSDELILLDIQRARIALAGLTDVED